MTMLKRKKNAEASYRVVSPIERAGLPARWFVIICLVLSPLILLSQQVSSLTINPSSFTIESGKVQQVNATFLDSNSTPISGKVTSGVPSLNFYPDSVVTNSSGNASTYYWAKWGLRDSVVTITASFDGDEFYSGSSNAATATITATTDGLIVPHTPFSSFDPLHQGDLTGSP